MTPTLQTRSSSPSARRRELERLGRAALLCLPLATLLQHGSARANQPGIEFRNQAGERLDLGWRVLRLANSRNPDPTSEKPCDIGDMSVVRYPLRIRRSDRAIVERVHIEGRVPQASDRIYTYCNSAAVAVFESHGVTVRSVTGRNLWDGIRFARDSGDFLLRNTWLANVRDDCVENDQVRSGRIIDVLFDGCFMGISIAPGRLAREAPPPFVAPAPARITLDAVLMRMKAYLHKGRVVTGVPFKLGQAPVVIDIRNSTFAFDPGSIIGVGRLRRAWASIGKCADNTLLWLGNEPAPTEILPLQNCFNVLIGAEARDRWRTLRANRIERFDAGARAAME